MTILQAFKKALADGYCFVVSPVERETWIQDVIHSLEETVLNPGIGLFKKNDDFDYADGKITKNGQLVHEFSKTAVSMNKNELTEELTFHCLEKRKTIHLEKLSKMDGTSQQTYIKKHKSEIAFAPKA